MVVSAQSPSGELVLLSTVITQKQLILWHGEVSGHHLPGRMVASEL